MPADFNKCVKAGGKVVTSKVSKGRHVRYCKDKKGEWHRGEVKKTKKKS